MRLIFGSLMAVSGLVLAACNPAVPDSGATAGVGFGDYQTYLKNREAALNGGGAVPAPMGAQVAPPQATVANAGAAIGAEPVSAVSLGSTSPSAPLPANILAAVPGGAPAPTSAPLPNAIPEPTSAVGAPLTTSTMLEQATAPAPQSVPAAVPANAPTISDENNFKAVAERQTIASDKERLAQMRANYQQVAPTDLPERSGNTGPNLASYALAATNSVGQSVYPRGGLHLTSSTRACEKFASPDLAQTAFLTSGGPKKDSKNLDPDGDGFACAWDPRPFQAARAQ